MAVSECLPVLLLIELSRVEEHVLADCLGEESGFLLDVGDAACHVDCAPVVGHLCEDGADEGRLTGTDCSGDTDELAL